MIVDLYLVYSFIRRLATPFNEWDAYKLGIIDERGNILKKRKTLATIKERDAFQLFDLLVLKIKRLIEKVPGGKSRLASYAAALYLIKEDWQSMSEQQLEQSLEQYFATLDESVDYQFELYERLVDEDVPANVASSGAIAGMGYNGPNDIKVPPAAASRYKRKNKKQQIDLAKIIKKVRAV